MDNLLDELEVIINDESLSDETKAKKQLEIFHKYRINPSAEKQGEDASEPEGIEGKEGMSVEKMAEQACSRFQ